MRQILVAGLFAVGLVAIAVPSFARTHVRAPAAAEDSIQDRYCIQGDQWGYNCEFSTYEQCKATLSGTSGTCSENLRYLFAKQRRGYRPPR
jgi:hypothetical protein